MAIAIRNTADSRFSHVIPVRYEEVAALSSTDGAEGVIDLPGVLPDEWIISRAAILVTESFDISGALTLSVGRDGDDDNWVADATLKSTGVRITNNGGIPETEAGSSGSSTDTIRLAFNPASDAALSEIAGGEAFVLLDIINVTNIKLTV